MSHQSQKNVSKWYCYWCLLQQGMITTFSLRYHNTGTSIWNTALSNYSDRWNTHYACWVHCIKQGKQICQAFSVVPHNNYCFFEIMKYMMIHVLTIDLVLLAFRWVGYVLCPAKHKNMRILSIGEPSMHFLNVLSINMACINCQELSFFFNLKMK